MKMPSRIAKSAGLYINLYSTDIYNCPPPSPPSIVLHIGVPRPGRLARMLCAIPDQLSSIASAPTTYLAIFLSTTMTAFFLFCQHAPRLRPRRFANPRPPRPHLRRTSTSSPLPITTRTPAEIAAFGRFPDYAALSGVPLPCPYHNFNIATACARPYRPFRWPYHQTMCMPPSPP